MAVTIFVLFVLSILTLIFVLSASEVKACAKIKHKQYKHTYIRSHYVQVLWFESRMPVQFCSCNCLSLLFPMRAASKRVAGRSEWKRLEIQLWRRLPQEDGPNPNRGTSGCYYCVDVLLNTEQKVFKISLNFKSLEKEK